MQRQQLNPDIQIKYDHLITHMTQKNAIVSEFINILKEICDADIFYSRTMEKFANNISKLMIGKDPLKEVFIIFERLIGAKAEQSMEMAKSIKDDMIPFVENVASDAKEQNDLRSKQKLVKDMKLNMQRKLKNLHLSESHYKRAYELLKRNSNAQTRAELQQRQKFQKIFNERQSNLIQSINSYNHTVQEYYLNYTSICQKLSDIETRRKLAVRDAINKFMIYEISCIKNIEYNIPRYMQNLGKMNDRLVIQDRVNINDNNEGLTNLAKISINNYICSLNDRDKIEIPNSHKRILQIKKNTENVIPQEQYHQLTLDLFKLLDEASLSYDVRVLKQIVYFSRGVYTVVGLPSQSTKEISQEQRNKKGKTMTLLLLDSIMCHQIFQNLDFWGKYEQKLFDIIQKQSKLSAIDTQSKEIQISLNFLAADLQFLKIVAYHKLPFNILSKFTIVQASSPQSTQPSSKSSLPALDADFIQFLEANSKYI